MIPFPIPFFNAAAAAAAIYVTAKDAIGYAWGPSPSGSVSSNPANAPQTAVTGGTGSYTYAWTLVGGSLGMTIDNAAIANPTWTLASASEALSPYEEEWRLLVTDSGTGATATVTITVTLTWFQA